MVVKDTSLGQQKKKVEVKAIRHFRLSLGTRFYLNLKDTFVVLSFRQNLVLVSLLDKLVILVHLETISFIYL